MYSAWATGVKLAWDVPRATRSYLVEEVLAPGVVSLQVNLPLRFRNFFRSLLRSPSQEVVVAALLGARDIRTTVGANLHFLKEETGLDIWQVSPGELRRVLLLFVHVCINSFKCYMFLLPKYRIYNMWHMYP